MKTKLYCPECDTEMNLFNKIRIKNDICPYCGNEELEIVHVKFHKNIREVRNIFK